MKLKFNEYGTRLFVVREAGDIVYRNNGYAGANAGESRLLYHVKQKLNDAGCDLVKKRMWKDGHLVGDQQQYLRVRKMSTDTPHVFIHNGYWQVEGAEVDFNERGETCLQVTMDVFGSQPDCLERLMKVNEVLDEQAR